VTANLAIVLTALYVLIDDHVIPSGPLRPGHPKKLSDAELVCLAVAQVLLGARAQHHWLGMCYARLGCCSRTCPVSAAIVSGSRLPLRCWPQCSTTWPRLPVVAGPGTANRRHPAAVRRLARDREAVRAGRMGRLRVLRRAFALVLGHESVPDHHPGRVPVALCLASPKTGEREVAAELFAHATRTDAMCPGLTLIGDKGFVGRDFLFQRPRQETLESNTNHWYDPGHTNDWYYTFNPRQVPSGCSWYRMGDQAETPT
jgi:hypothetical protein